MLYPALHAPAALSDLNLSPLFLPAVGLPVTAVCHACPSINQVMWAEAEACTHEAVRLEQAAAKLHALSVELDGRRTAMLETRKIEAAQETAKR